MQRAEALAEAVDSAVPKAKQQALQLIEIKAMITYAIEIQQVIVQTPVTSDVGADDTAPMSVDDGA